MTAQPVLVNTALIYRASALGAALKAEARRHHESGPLLWSAGIRRALRTYGDALLCCEQPRTLAMLAGNAASTLYAMGTEGDNLRAEALALAASVKE